jgi:hypothetical protein
MSNALRDKIAEALRAHVSLLSDPNCLLEEYVEVGLSAIEQAGYCVVPKEPTSQMRAAAYPHIDRETEAALHVYRAMISASQEAQG